jgi:hypothetical protein
MPGLSQPAIVAIHSQAKNERNLPDPAGNNIISTGPVEMGIVADFRQINEFEYASFRRSPLGAYQLAFGSNTNIRVALKDFADWSQRLNAEARAIQKPYSETGLFDRLSSVNFDPARLSRDDQRLFQEQKVKLAALHAKHARPHWHQFTVDKAWHAIHFLLTGQTEGGDPPLAWTILGGLELKDEKNYTEGNALRMLSPDQVKEVAEALAGISADQLLSRATIADMISKEIYGVSEDEKMAREYIHSCYAELRDFYAEAAKKGNGMLLLLT